MPGFTLSSTTGNISLESMLGNGKILLLFYTEDNTPTCTTQVSSFGDEYSLVQELGATVLGISVDSLDTHQAFAQRINAPFPLLTDLDGSISQAYGVYDPIIKRSVRAAFVIDETGVLLYKNLLYVPGNMGHYIEVFEALGAVFG